MTDADRPADELLTAIAALTGPAESLVLVDADSRRVSWFSDAAADCLPALCTGGSIDAALQAFPALRALLDAADDHGDALAVPHRSVDGEARLCTLGRHADGWISLRFQGLTGDQTQLHRYLEDREKLFSTSRTLSVSEMASTLAHELNQPIGSISNLLRGARLRLGKQAAVDEDILASLDKAVEQARFAARIISRIRDFTQAREPRREALELRALVAESIGLLDWVIDQAGVRLDFDRGSTPCRVAGDRTMLQQVLTNLVRNAIDAMQASPADKRLSIRIEPDVVESSVQITISDTGHGLGDVDETTLFVPFLTGKQHGMGIGLNICRSFIELHQGRLWLTPNDQGGCSAHISLPLLDQQAKHGRTADERQYGIHTG